jgi:N6-adenosine-specific RNA methylase IME4
VDETRGWAIIEAYPEALEYDGKPGGDRQSGKALYQGYNAFSWLMVAEETGRGKQHIKKWVELAKRVGPREEDFADFEIKEREAIPAKFLQAISGGKKREDSEPLEPIEGKYNVIVIDPPWAYGTDYDSESRRVASPYPEKSTTELMEFDLPAAPDCALWLWTTHRFIWDAKLLMDTWGFEYKLTVPWDKEKMGMGVWLRCQTEFVLLGIKGKPPWKLTNERDIIREARREHSRKPDSFYEMVEKINGTATEETHADIFARTKRKGWYSYGNEVEKFGDDE